MKNRPAKKKNAPTPKRKYTRKKEVVVANKKTASPERVVVSDAEATIKFAILDGIIDQWHKKDEPNFAQRTRDKVFENLFRPEFGWAIGEYLATLK